MIHHLLEKGGCAGGVMVILKGSALSRIVSPFIKKGKLIVQTPLQMQISGERKIMIFSSKNAAR